ncbi:MAG TPA: hypothetical protein VG714_06355 [Acidobacteriaceae bacterium]|nr:hypothetical protein [Acidobacteriaceae bacterium]
MAGRETEQQRRQSRGLMWLALAALGLAMARAITHGGVHTVFPHGWWRIW